MEHLKQKIEVIRGWSSKKKSIVALLLILPAPLIGVSSSFHMPSIRAPFTDEIEIGKIIWAIANRKGVLAGLVWSVLFAIIIFVLYGLIRETLIPPSAKHQILELGITSPAHFFIFASVMSLGNSLMEEYVWRWFVFSKFKLLLGVWPAIILSAFFFTVHHIVIMWNFGSLWLVFLGSIGLFTGAIIWAWLYNKYNSIWPGWICHVAADTAIMWITWWIITGN